MTSPKFRLIILGAGFSKPAGFPLANELWDEILKTGLAYPKNLRASKFGSGLARYQKYLREAEGRDLPQAEVDFEQFMNFLDIEHYLGLRGSDTWSDEGNEETLVVKQLIGRILTARLKQIDEVPRLYLEFARRLEPYDVVMTFNYDTLLERALDEVGRPYRLVPNRFKSVHGLHNIIDESHDDKEVVVLKVHGSIDWFDRSPFYFAEQEYAKVGPNKPEDFLWSNPAAFGLEPLDAGPRHEDDPLKNIFRARHLEGLFDDNQMFLRTPRILPPATSKLLYMGKHLNFWEGANHLGYGNFGLAIIGFSLPPHDNYMRQILYRIVKNYEAGVDSWPNQDRPPFTVVDMFFSPEQESAFKDRYRFVDWGRARLKTDGFDLSSLDLVFG